MSIHKRTDKQITAYSYGRIWLNNKKEWTIDTHNMGEPQNCYAEWKKPEMRGVENILYDSTYVKLWKMQSDP